jgi:hypothetical protein
VSRGRGGQRGGDRKKGVRRREGEAQRDGDGDKAHAYTHTYTYTHLLMLFSSSGLLADDARPYIYTTNTYTYIYTYTPIYTYNIPFDAVEQLGLVGG